MGTVNGILNQKPVRKLLSALPDETVLTATQRMNEFGVGALLVMEAGRIVGIFTERDVLRRVVAEELDPAITPVGDVMTRQVACCTLEMSVDDVQNLMRHCRIRHLPVIDDQENVLGIISIGDVNAYHASNQDVTIHYLHEYLYGRW